MSSISSAEIITRLQAQGIQAIECPACGRVREVQEDRILAHGDPLCAGSGFFVQPPDSPDFDAVVADMAAALKAEEEGDWVTMAHTAVEEHLAACFQSLECAAGDCPHPQGTCPPCPAHSPFDGCVTCIAREAIIETWQFAAEAEAEEVVAWLLFRANDATPKAAGLISHLAQHIANGDHREDDEEREE